MLLYNANKPFYLKKIIQNLHFNIVQQYLMLFVAEKKSCTEYFLIIKLRKYIYITAIFTSLQLDHGKTLLNKCRCVTICDNILMFMVIIRPKLNYLMNGHS